MSYWIPGEKKYKGEKAHSPSVPFLAIEETDDYLGTGAHGIAVAEVAIKGGTR